MPTLSPAMLQALEPFVPLFSRRIWPRVLVLVAGTLLAPGKRTVTAALRVMGLAQTRTLRALSSRLEPGALVESRGQSRAAECVGGGLRPERAAAPRHR